MGPLSQRRPVKGTSEAYRAKRNIFWQKWYQKLSFRNSRIFVTSEIRTLASLECSKLRTLDTYHLILYHYKKFAFVTIGAKKIATQSDFDKAGQTSLVFATIFVAKWP